MAHNARASVVRQQVTNDTPWSAIGQAKCVFGLAPCSCVYVYRYPAINFQDLSYYSAPKQKSEKVSREPHNQPIKWSDSSRMALAQEIVYPGLHRYQCVMNY